MLQRRMPGRLMGSVPLLSGGGGLTYDDKVLGYNPLAYWPLWEPSGGVAYDISGNGFHGAYIGVTLGQPGIGDGNTAPLFDGINDVVNVYSAGLAAAWPYDEGSVAGWLKVFNAGVWTDATERMFFTFAEEIWGANYQITFKRTTNNNQVNYFRDDGAGVEVQQSVGGQSATVWTQFAVTWSVISGNLKAYLAGSQIGSTQAGVASASGPLKNSHMVVGAQTSGAGSPWHGWLARPAVFNSVLSDPDIADLAVVV